jgi:hypothetical protein
MATNETNKGKCSEIIFKGEKKKQRAIKKEKKLNSNGKKPYLKKNEGCFLFPNFKPTSKQTKIQKLERNTFFIILNIF